MHNVLNPHGPAAATLASYGWTVLVLFLVVTGVMWALLVWVALRKRGSFREHAPIGAGGGLPWILIGGVGIPAAVLIGIFLGMLTELNAFPLEHGHSHPAAQIRVTGHRWWWEVEYRIGGVQQYVKTATELHIPIGRPIDIELITDDVIHSFWVPALHGKVDLIPQTPTRIEIQADDAGVYAGECAEFCGGQHANMLFWVVAEPQAQFDAWLTRQREDAVAPDTPSRQRGQQVFTSHACVLCHTIRGTAARASVGPDLTHVGARRSLAGPFPNNESWLRAWVSHAQSLKPGVRMPSLNQFDEGELQALTDYLLALK
jgi:cytochrome c oxidase subunit 2